MRQTYIWARLLVFCCLSLTACNKGDEEDEDFLDFVTDETHCVVSLPREYDFSYVNEGLSVSLTFSEKLYKAKTVDGNPKKGDFRYYNVQKGEPFRIVKTLSLIRDKLEEGKILVGWQLNSELKKLYREDGSSRFGNYSSTVFSCDKNTEITPVYCDYRPVGMLIYPEDEDGDAIDPAEIFGEDGAIEEKEGVYYFYGVYDFEPEQTFWRTNLTIKKYEVTERYTNYEKSENTVYANYNSLSYLIDVEFDKGDLFEKGSLKIEKLYKIEGRGYLALGSTGDAYENHVNSLFIGKNEIKYSFN